MCRWPPALLSTIRAGASPAARGMETPADCPVTNTVSNRATAALSLAPRDCCVLPHALLGGHYHMETVGLVDVVDQGRETLTELRPMTGHGSYVRRLDRHHSRNGERCGR